MKYDLIIRNGTVVDGTGGPRRVADVAITAGRVADIGQISGDAAKEIDATGLIVAPGIIDLHTHYDAQLHWDPYCTASGWHGTTTVVLGNCGFGFAPVRPGMADRYMYMMENTEQVPYDVMKRTMDWSWQTFPEWLNHLKSLPRGVNTATYLPMNALLSYVVGPDEAKKRPATTEERAEMRRIMHEAMDAGASGFALSYLGAQGNNHLDHDQTPMPTDIMDAEEAYNLADVLKERGEGVIQLLVEVPGTPAPRRDVPEELARRSGRPVLYNMVVPSDTHPEQHGSVLDWMSKAVADGLDMYCQGFTFRKPLEVRPQHFNVWDTIPIFRDYTAAPDKVALSADPEFRARMAREYDKDNMREAAGALEYYKLQEVPEGSRYQQFVGKTVEDVAAAFGQPGWEAFLDIVVETKADVLFTNPSVGAFRAETTATAMRNPRLLAGVSDGGAHSKHGNGGFWSTDMIIWMTRESNALSLEEVHMMLSKRNADAFGLRLRGTIEAGNFADIIVYDHAQLDYTPRFSYEVVPDLPGGDWRKVKRNVGIRHILVNGVVTFNDSVPTGATPGMMIANHRSPAGGAE